MAYKHLIHTKGDNLDLNEFVHSFKVQAIQMSKEEIERVFYYLDPKEGKIRISNYISIF